MALVKLSKHTHGTLKLDTKKALLKYATKHIIDINIAEIGPSSSCFPVLILPGSQGALSIGILTSFDSGANLFSSHGQWQAIYLPQSVQSSPFYLVADKERPSHYELALDDEDEALSSGVGEPIFDVRTGKASIHVAQVESLLNANVANAIHTVRFIEMLKAYDLLKSIELVVSYKDNTQKKIAGVFTIDEEKLHDLSGEVLQNLNTRGYLLPMHAMLTSLYQVNALIRLHNIDSDDKIQKVTFQLARQ